MNNSSASREVWLFEDLFFGDQCKGTTIEFIAKESNAHTVIRFRGGAQAAHTIVRPDGYYHQFQQFGSATFLPGVRTHLTRFMVMSPWRMMDEEERLKKLGVIYSF